MRKLTIYTDSPEETERLGERIGRALFPSTVVALKGDLGAGKTTLAKGIARGLDVDDLVHSPTFTLIHEHDGRLPVYHFDLYRLDTPEQIEDLGYEDYFYSPGVTVIEWAEKIEKMLPDDRLEILISGGDECRTFELLATGPNSSAIIENFQNN